MNVAVCLLLYSFAVAVLGPRPLVRVTRAGVAPRLGVVAWLAAIGTVVASWAFAAVFLAGELIRDWNQPGRTVVSACVAVLHDAALGRDGRVVQVGLLVLVACAVSAVAVLCWRLGRVLVRARILLVNSVEC